MVIPIKQINAHNCRVDNRERQHKVWKVLSYWDQGTEKMKSMLDCRGSHGCRFPVGLYPYVHKKLNENGHLVIYKPLAYPKINYKLIPKLPDIRFEPYQRKMIANVGPRNRGVLVGPTGCITEDTIININRAKIGKKSTIENLYKKHNNIKAQGKPWNHNIPTYVRSLQKEKIKLNQIEDIVYSGIKKVYQLILCNGKSIKATANHKIMTKEGWVKLIKLTNDSRIMCDSLHTKSNNKKKKKLIYEQYTNLWFHPYASKTKTNKEKRGYTKRVEKHRIIYEAQINNLTVEKFIKIVKTNKEKTKTLRFIDPKKFHIHHRDHNHKNNNPDNLFKLTKKKHHTYHADNDNSYKNFNQGVPTYSKVKSIKYIGEEKTYDIICKAPHHNFVANGIVIHNSGKTVVMGGMVDKLHVPQTIIITPTKQILNQTYDRFVEWFPDYEIGKVGDGEKGNGHIIISLFQSLRKLKVKSCDLVIVDECHRMNKSIDRILRNLPKTHYRFGLTATPQLRKDFDKWALMIGNIGPIIHETTDQQAIERVTDVQINLLKFICNRPTGGNYQEVLRNDVLFSTDRCSKMLKAATQVSLNDGGNCLILLDEVEHGNVMVKIAQEMGLKPMFANGKNKGDINDQIKSKLNNRQVQLVIATSVFGIGTDIPNVDCVGIASARKSYIDTIQKIGRGRRRVKGKDKLKVIDFIDNVKGKDRFHKHFYAHSIERLNIYKEKEWEIKKLYVI